MSFGVESIVVRSPHEKFGYSTLPAMLRDDVAIVKIGAHDLPYLTLASASTIHVQDSVTALAFPGDADLDNFPVLLDPTRSDVNTLNSLTNQESGFVHLYLLLVISLILFRTVFM
jgi:S1-C subfamily serine protease